MPLLLPSARSRRREDKVRARTKVPEQCFDSVNAIGVKILQSEMADAQDHFEQNQQYDDNVEQYEAAIASDVEHENE
jgi:hypothetical protein